MVKIPKPSQLNTCAREYGTPCKASPITCCTERPIGLDYSILLSNPAVPRDDYLTLIHPTFQNQRTYIMFESDLPQVPADDRLDGCPTQQVSLSLGGRQTGGALQSLMKSKR